METVTRTGYSSHNFFNAVINEFMLTRHAKLILPLCTLLEKRNLSNAADALALSKSAISKILKKAREVFDDALLERCGNEMFLTPKAMELLPKLQRLRAAASECFPDKTEDISDFHGEISIQMNCDLLHAAGASVIKALKGQFPNILLNLSSLNASYQDKLAKGVLDFAIYLDSNLGNPFISKKLFKSTPKIFVPHEHPLAHQTINYNQLLKHECMVPNNFIKGAKLEAAVKLMQKDFSTQYSTLKTDNISLLFQCAINDNSLVIASRLLMIDPLIQSHFYITNLPVPFDGLFDMLDQSLIWHQRTEHSQVHIVVAQVIEDVFNELFKRIPVPVTDGVLPIIVE